MYLVSGGLVMLEAQHVVNALAPFTGVFPCIQLCLDLVHGYLFGLNIAQTSLIEAKWTDNVASFAILQSGLRHVSRYNERSICCHLSIMELSTKVPTNEARLNTQPATAISSYAKSTKHLQN